VPNTASSKAKAAAATTTTTKSSSALSQQKQKQDPHAKVKAEHSNSDHDPDDASPARSYPATTSRALRMSYRIARGEQGVLTFEPYKSMLLPLWRFRTPSIARASSAALWARFVDFDAHDDFVGMDMARKFVQMGMTRAKRYANHKGGRKYGVDGKELEKSTTHGDRGEKEEASAVFREVWERCRGHEGYQRRKKVFQEEQKGWDKEVKKEEGKVGRVKEEELDV